MGATGLPMQAVPNELLESTISYCHNQEYLPGSSHWTVNPAKSHALLNVLLLL